MHPLTLLLLAALAALATPRAAAQTPAAAPPALAITRVHVVDVEGGRVLPEQTVLVAGNRIQAVGPSARTRVPTGARVVDGRGKYLIPGLWDMHVHALWSETTSWMFPALVANGVTGVRDLWGNLTVARQLRERAKAGELLGPRFTLSGHILDGPQPSLPGMIAVATAGDARRAVDSLQAAGAEFIKAYQRLPREAFFAIMDQAKQRGISVVGHVPPTVTLAEAVAAGLKSLEHPERLIFGCLGDEAAARRAHEDSAAARRAAAARGDTAEAMRLVRSGVERTIANAAGATCEELARHFVQHDAAFTPTLVVVEALSTDMGRARDTLGMRYISPARRTRWEERTATRRRYPPLVKEFEVPQFEQLVRLTGMMHRQGVRVLAGSDMANPFVYPGFSLHRELELLVRAGLSPLEALRAATLNPARFLGAADSLGTVAPRKLADLVLLDANPLADIRNTEKIRAVVTDGRYLDRARLDALLVEAARAAEASGAAPQ